MATFGERLKTALEYRNMKKSVLAYRLGIDRSYITNYINEKYRARPEMIDKMAEILGVSPAWLNGYDVNMLDGTDETVSDRFDGGEDVIIFHRDGKNVIRHFTKEQMKMLQALIDAMPDSDSKG